ncbi:undecaprenyl-diphosphatase [Lutibacter agarilyticus]|uniref:Undecaprenyl-diphosphatase n=1 Tax=Lutibacter agarilyticus TaxID=1109740 RepID=A0A238VVK8_9FLAO|nr:phosphatase PAP2 family protein [Lutibacter agarilyticus]SNR38167.1 undecaprenyl-diphosphatase [Lutibacter agarilyticus]
MFELLNTLINYDKQLLLFLHSQGNPFWDEFWLFITNPTHWIPFYILLFILGYKVFGIKKAILIAFFTALSTLTTLLAVLLIKSTIQRLRPINDTSINTTIRILIEDTDFSFVSGHSSVSFTIAFLSYWILRKKYRYVFLVFLFPILFAYSRIYLAAHFPFDILFGMLLGYLIAKFYFKIVQKRVFEKTAI